MERGWTGGNGVGQRGNGVGLEENEVGLEEMGSDRGGTGSDLGITRLDWWRNGVGLEEEWGQIGERMGLD